MARKEKSSPAEAIIEIASLMPWWLCIGLAAVSYVALHAYAISPAAPIVPGQAAAGVVPLLLKGVATAGQYILPILFCFAALLSFINRAKANKDQLGPNTATPTNATRASSAPSCPICAGSMVMRKAKKGAKAGSTFWGCTSYPDCKGTKAIG
jgi:restriction system protein